jgi:hypothetical protein
MDTDTRLRSGRPPHPLDSPHNSRLEQSLARRRKSLQSFPSRGRASDRRMYRRFKVSEATLIVYDHHFDYEVGFITDLSRKGLAFEYFDLAYPLKEKGELDILLGDSDFCIYAIPYRAVFDIAVTEHEPSPVPIRRCGVEFLDMDLEKIAEIDILIHVYAIEVI